MQNRALIIDASFRINEIRQTFKATATSCRFFMILHYLLWVLLIAGTNAECPVEFNPQRVVVKYGSSVSVNCSTNITHTMFRWEVKEGQWSKIDENLTTWRVESLTRWDIKAMCFINYDRQCERDLPITIYKTPDSVSINTADHTGPMTEGSTYKLQCDVVNVAPVQTLTVKWYKGDTLMHNENFTDPIKRPVNKTSILQITADRSYDGVQYRCEAELELGAEGPQPPPAVTSEPLNITVYFKPIINETKLPSTLSVFRGYPVVLVCEAEGKPKPEISWSKSNGMRLKTPDGNLTVNEFEKDDFYTCSANNSINTTTRRVNLVIHDNYYLLKIVGIVVGILLFILIISIFICSKTAKMGQYSLKNAPICRICRKGLTAQ